MSKGIIKFESRMQKLSMLEIIIRKLEKHNINYKTTKKDQLITIDIADDDADRDLKGFLKNIMEMAERRGYEGYVE